MRIIIIIIIIRIHKLFMYSPHCSHIFVKLLVGRICLNIKKCIFGDHLLDSHVLYIWLSSDLVRKIRCSSLLRLEGLTSTGFILECGIALLIQMKIYFGVLNLH